MNLLPFHTETCDDFYVIRFIAGMDRMNKRLIINLFYFLAICLVYVTKWQNV